MMSQIDKVRAMWHKIFSRSRRRALKKAQMRRRGGGKMGRKGNIHVPVFRRSMVKALGLSAAND